MPRKMLAVNYSIAFGLMFFSCGLKAAPRPDWVEKKGAKLDFYPSDTFITGFGMSASTGEEVDKRNSALAMARREVVSAIRVRVTSLFIDQAVEKDNRLSQLAVSIVKTESEMELEGLDKFEYFLDEKKGIYYALAILEKARTSKLIKEKIHALSKQCETLLDAYQIDRDISTLLNAKQLAGRIEENLIVLGVLTGSFPSEITYPKTEAVLQKIRRDLSTEKGLDGYLGGLVFDLGYSLPVGVRVLVDGIYYADTRFGGTFSFYVANALSEKIAKIGNAVVIDKALMKEAVLNGGSDQSVTATLNPQAIVYGKYFDLGDMVKLSLRATSSSGEMISASEVVIPKSIISASGLKLTPDNFEEALKTADLEAAKIKDSKLQIRLNIDRGNGGVYRKGDKLFVFLKSNMNCFVKLVYHQADESNILIFPNLFHPNALIEKDRLYQIPPDKSDFEFNIEGPFGAEVIKAFASTVPFELEEGTVMGPGFKLLSDDFKTTVNRARGITVKAKEAMYSEDTAVITTIDSDSIRSEGEIGVFHQ